MESRLVAVFVFVIILSRSLKDAQACAGWSYKEKDQVGRASGMTFIEAIYDDPFDMFNDWMNEARAFNVRMPTAFTFATTGREGKVSARTIHLRRIDEDGFVILTVKNTKKTRDISEMPNGSMVFLWDYEKKGRRLIKQIRVEVRVEELQPQDFTALYEEEPLYMKLQYAVCQQGQIAEWQDTKEKHDQLWMEVLSEGKTLPMPEKITGFKLLPEVMEFYMSNGNMIADRMLYIQSMDKTWSHHRIAA